MEGMTEVNDQAENTRSIRDLPPAHYAFKIENFSLLSNTKVDSVESGDFEVDSYKWYVGSTLVARIYSLPQMVSSSSVFTMPPFIP